MFPFTEDYLRSLALERDRDERHTRLLHELRVAASATGAAEPRHHAAKPSGLAYSGPERRRGIPCPDIAEAMTP